ncbi:MAG: hypothetical protein NZ823_02240, partial [Blastocatellia bacterium]|nr:hypothetical protein [Blastocatellia bacterium]
HRMDVTPVLVDTVPCCPGVCCRTEFIPQGERRTFVFTLNPVDATVPEGTRELQCEARIGDWPCVLPPVETQAVRAMRRPLLVRRPAPQVHVSITPFVGVCEDGSFNARIQVMGAPSATANLTLQKISGSMGEARFAANNMTTLNHVTVTSAGTTVAIRGMTQSDLPDNMQLTATLTSGQQASSERFSVEVLDVNVCADVVRTKVYPSEVNGIFTLRVTRAGGQQPIVLVDRQTRAGGASYQDGLSIDNANSYPAGTYLALEAVWNVGGVECRNQFTRFPMPFTVLESYLITCYIRALESEYPAQQVNTCTSRVDPCRYTSNLFRRAFLDTVILNGRGRTLDGHIIQPDGICNNAPANCPSYRGRVFRFPSDGRTSCGVVPQAGITLARMCQNPQFRECGDRVCLLARDVLPIGTEYRVEDAGCNNRQTQFDRFMGDGTQICPGNWPNPTARVIRLGR